MLYTHLGGWGHYFVLGTRVLLNKHGVIGSLFSCNLESTVAKRGRGFCGQDYSQGVGWGRKKNGANLKNGQESEKQGN